MGELKPAFAGAIDYLASINQDVDPEEACPVCGKKLYTVIKRYGKTFVLPVACLCRTGTAADRQKRALYDAARKNRIRCFSGQYKGLRDTDFSKDQWYHKDVSIACMAYCDKFLDTKPGGDHQGRGLMLYGPNGSGKSFLAACICNALIDKGYRCLYTSIPDIETRVKASYGAEVDLMHQIEKADLVVIDDFGSERQTDYTSELTFKTLEARMAKPTVITTNYTPQQLMDSDDGRQRRIFDRIFERFQPIKAGGESIRRSGYDDRVEEGREWLGGEA